MEMPAQKKIVKFLAIALFAIVSPSSKGWQARAQEKVAQASYPAMAPVTQYLIADEKSQIALARSAAPPSISDGAEVMVLGPNGDTTAVKGKNGFLCIVERSWAAASTDADFWNPKVRAPICFNLPAAKTFLPIFLMRSKLVLAAKSKADMVAMTTAAMDTRELPPLDTAAVGYMMSKQQYLNDRDQAWHPHVMFLVPGDAVKTWGADRPESPVMAASDPEERVTIAFVLVANWSDGTPAPRTAP